MTGKVFIMNKREKPSRVIWNCPEQREKESKLDLTRAGEVGENSGDSEGQGKENSKKSRNQAVEIARGQGDSKRENSKSG